MASPNAPTVNSQPDYFAIVKSGFLSVCKTVWDGIKAIGKFFFDLIVWFGKLIWLALVSFKDVIVEICRFIWGLIVWGKGKYDLVKHKDPDQNSASVQVIKKLRLEGLKDSVKPGIHFLERLLWIIVFIYLLIYTAILTYDAVDDYINKPIDFTDHGTTSGIKTSKFAVTVCPPTLFNQAIVAKAKGVDENVRFFSNIEDERVEVPEEGFWTRKESSSLLHIVHYICELGSKFRTHLGKNLALSNLKYYMDKNLNKDSHAKDDPSDKSYGEKILPFVQKGLIDCSKAILACRWEGSIKNGCKELFVPAQTDVGTCCTFNKIPEAQLRGQAWLQVLLNDIKTSKEDSSRFKNWNIDDSLMGSSNTSNENQGPKEQTIPGKENGLSFILKFDEEIEDVEKVDNSCQLNEGHGYQVGVHSPIEDPEMRLESTPIPPNNEVFIRVDSDVTFSNENIKELSIEKRKCYFQNENPLNQYKNYTTANCRNECKANLVREKCKCNLLSATDGKKEDICGPQNSVCVQEAKANLTIHGYEKSCPKLNCHPACNEIHYNTHVAYLPFSKSQTQKHRKEYGNQTFSIVHVYSSESATMRERKRSKSLSDFIGVLGGIWGLTIGLTLMRLLSIFLGFGTGITKTFNAFFWKCLRNCCGIYPEEPENAIVEGDRNDDGGNIEDENIQIESNNHVAINIETEEPAQSPQPSSSNVEVELINSSEERDENVLFLKKRHGKGVKDDSQPGPSKPSNGVFIIDIDS